MESTLDQSKGEEIHTDRLKIGPNFDETFPQLMKCIANYDQILNFKEVQAFCRDLTVNQKERQLREYNFWADIKTLILAEEVTNEILRVLPEWKELMKQHDKHICVHTVCVLYLICNEPQV